MPDGARDVRFDNSYARLPERFYARVQPMPVAAPATVRVNRPLAEQLGFDPDFLASAQGAQFVAGNRLFEGSAPIATVYAGHQFGSWNPRLGDGRAILLGEVIGRDGERYDLQLKGSGRTPYSRSGDGRSPLGPALREYVVSEAMFALGIPTTRTLAVATTGERVQRERALPGGILVRVASSHVRVGTFEYFAAAGDLEALRMLVEHVVARHYPELRETGRRTLELLRAVVQRQAALIARWQLVGFIHGVMNTDNMLVSGETIDYGPCAFMDGYDPATVFSSIDHAGRYAYGNQPRAAHFNLACLAQALMPVLQAELGEAALRAAQDAIDAFPGELARRLARGMAQKLGLRELQESDEPLVDDLLALMQQSQADFTLTFRRLAELAHDASGGARSPSERLGAFAELPEAFAPWLERWRARCAQEPTSAAERQAAMVAANPALIPRNHLVEAAIAAAEQANDFEPFHALVDALATPYAYRAALEPFARPPRLEQRVLRTFCGT